MKPSIHRASLFEAIGFPSGKLPPFHEQTFPCLSLRSQYPDCIAYEGPVIVRAAPPKSYKSSKHRIFVVCPCCKKEIPFGRLHQHRDTETCLRKGLRVGDKVRVKEPKGGYYSSYAGRPVFFLTPDIVGTVGAVNVPFVTGKEDTFVCVDFLSPMTNQQERAGVEWNNIIFVERL